MLPKPDRTFRMFRIMQWGLNSNKVQRHAATLRRVLTRVAAQLPGALRLRALRHRVPQALACVALHRAAPRRADPHWPLTLAAASDEPKPISDATGWDPLRRSAFLDIDAASGGAAARCAAPRADNDSPACPSGRAATVTNRGSADKWQMARTVQSAAPTGVVRAARRPLDGSA
jgi:hypothetical protein